MKLFVLMTIILNLVAMHIIEDAGECIVNVRGCLCHVIVMYSENEDCQWGPWDRETDCSKTCGGGYREIYKKALVMHKNGGKECPSNELEVHAIACNIHDCPGI